MRQKLYLSTIDPKAGQLARDYGLGVEIAEYCTAWNMDADFARTDQTVRRAIDGVQRRIFHAPFNELFPCAIDPQARALAARRYRQAMELAAEYDCKKLVIHGGYVTNVYFPAWYTQQSVCFWREFLETAPEDVTIFLENVLEEEPQMLLDILRQVKDPRLRMCLDVGHAHVYSKIPVMEWLEACAPWIGHFHIHNNDGSWDSHCPLDQGTIPMEKLLGRIEQLCPQASLTLELAEAESSVRNLLEA